MSPWTALLQSLHSAMIDELVERHPEPKPTLGLPVRQREFAAPSSAVSEIYYVQTGFDLSTGYIFIAMEPGCAEDLKTTPQELWNSLLKRAGAEFMRREIKPKLSHLLPLPSRGGVIETSGTIGPMERIIWSPFTLKSGTCFLGLGV